MAMIVFLLRSGHYQGSVATAIVRLKPSLFLFVAYLKEQVFRNQARISDALKQNITTESWHDTETHYRQHATSPPEVPSGGLWPLLAH